MKTQTKDGNLTYVGNGMWTNDSPTRPPSYEKDFADAEKVQRLLQIKVDNLTAQRDELLAALKGVFDIVENEIGYRLDSEFPHERKYAQSMIDARTAIDKCKAQP